MGHNGSHIGAVGDLEHKTSNYRYSSLDALPFNLPHVKELELELERTNKCYNTVICP